MTAPRIATLKTWQQLERIARSLRLSLFRSDGCVTVQTSAGFELATITTGNPLDDDNADRVTRAALAGALEELALLEARAP